MKKFTSSIRIVLVKSPKTDEISLNKKLECGKGPVFVFDFFFFLFLFPFIRLLTLLPIQKEVAAASVSSLSLYE